MLVMGTENVAIARVLLELKLQHAEEMGWEWEPSIVKSYHRLCFLDGISGFDRIPLAHLASVQQWRVEQGFSECSWIRIRIQRGSCPDLRDTSHDTPRPQSWWKSFRSFFKENVYTLASARGSASSTKELKVPKFINLNY